MLLQALQKHFACTTLSSSLFLQHEKDKALLTFKHIAT